MRLGIVEAGGGTEDQKVQFYTGLYHSLLAPTTFSDANGEYLGFDNNTHKLSSDAINGRVQQAFYTDMSIWDVHRTQFPLLALLYPDVMSDIAQSLVLMYQQGGDLPRWPIANGSVSALYLVSP